MVSDFRMALVGDLRAQLARDGAYADQVIKTAAATATERTKLEMRAALAVVFRRGRNVTGALRSKLYPTAGKARAGFIYSKFGFRDGDEFTDFFGPYRRGAVLRSRWGRFMLIDARDPTRSGRPQRRGTLDDEIAAAKEEKRLFLKRASDGRLYMFANRRGRANVSKGPKLLALLAREVRVPALPALSEAEDLGFRRFYDEIAAKIVADNPQA